MTYNLTFTCGGRLRILFRFLFRKFQDILGKFKEHAKLNIVIKIKLSCVRNIVNFEVSNDYDKDICRSLLVKTILLKRNEY